MTGVPVPIESRTMQVVPRRARARWGAALALALSPLASSCATTASDEELARLRRDVHTLRSELAATKDLVTTLEGRVTLLAAGGGDRRAPAEPDRRAAPEPAPAGGRPSLPVVKLEPSASQGPPAGGRPASRSKSRDPDSGAQDDGSPPILIKVGPSDVGEKLTVDKDVLDKPDPVLATKGARATDKKEKADYDAALEALRGSRDFGRARELFLAFQARHPRSDLIDNASYWLAECSFAEAQYARAIEELAKLIADRPGAPKVPDALLLTAEAWLKLGKSKEAEDVLRRLIKSHPNSAARAAADKRLAELGAT